MFTRCKAWVSVLSYLRKINEYKISFFKSHVKPLRLETTSVSLFLVISLASSLLFQFTLANNSLFQVVSTRASAFQVVKGGSSLFLVLVYSSNHIFHRLTRDTTNSFANKNFCWINKFISKKIRNSMSFYRFVRLIIDRFRNN